MSLIRRHLQFLSGCLILSTATIAGGQDPTTPPASKANPEQPVSYWMQKKLEYSQTVLASLASGDLQQVAKSAEQLKLLNKVEGFVRSQVPNYPAQLHAFEFATQELGRQAKNENLEGATLAFHQLTTSCVNCHILIREQRR